MDRILITGGSGLLGANLILDAINRYDVFAVSHTHPVYHEKVECLTRDLRETESWRELVHELRPDVIVNCAGATELDACERDPELAYQLNRDVAAELARSAGAIGAYFVHISTDAVFDGQSSGYSEESVASPLSVYGKSKLAGENAVLEANPLAAIVRTNFFGWNAQPKQSLGEWFLSRLRAHKRTPGFLDVRFNPILVNHLIEVLFKIIKLHASGIVHVVGRDCITKFEFGNRVAKVFGLNAELIEAASIDQDGLIAPRAKCLCLSVERIETLLEERMPSADYGLASFKTLGESTYPEQLHALLSPTDR